MGAAATPMLRMRKQAQPGSDAGPRLGVCALTHSARRSRRSVAALGPVAGAHLACLSCSSVMSGSFLPRSLCTCRIPCPECCHPRAVRGCIQLSPPQRGHPWKTENNDIPASLTVILSAHLSAAPPCDARSLSRGGLASLQHPLGSPRAGPILFSVTPVFLWGSQTWVLGLGRPRVDCPREL